MQAQIDEAIELLESVIKYYTKRNGQSRAPMYVKHQIDQALTKLKEEPEQGEFTKNILANLKRWDSVLSKEEDCRKRSIVAYLKEVCYRYDYLVKRNKKLHAENKKLVEGQKG